MENIIQEIREERAKQDKKWGEQDHPILDPALLKLEGAFQDLLMCERYEIPNEEQAKDKCQRLFTSDFGTYMDILIEEISEAVSCLNDTQSMRKELIQCAAVVIAMIESLDRNGR